MPFCNFCGHVFDADVHPGALMFGHPPSNLRPALVWKAHFCQECEEKLTSQFAIQPKDCCEAMVAQSLAECAGMLAAVARGGWAEDGSHWGTREKAMAASAKAHRLLGLEQPTFDQEGDRL